MATQMEDMTQVGEQPNDRIIVGPPNDGNKGIGQWWESYWGSIDNRNHKKKEDYICSPTHLVEAT